MTRFGWLAVAVSMLAACGDDGGETPIDAVESDAEVDAQDIDTPPAPTFSGSISILEAAVLNPGTQGTIFGQGPQISVSFVSTATVPGPIMQEDPTSALGCKAWQYTAVQAAAAAAGLDEGVVQFTLTGTTPPMIPPCGFAAGVGYACPHTGTASTGGAISAGPNAGTARLTDADNNFSDNNTLGRYVRIAGANTMANNGVFPIVARPSSTQIVYANQAFVAETLPGTASHVNVYGVGPIPGAADPGFLQNDNAVSVTLTAGGANNIATFTSTTGNQTFGDDFTLATAEAAKLNAIPKTGAAFTVTCSAAGCPAGSAAGTVLNIVTTDTPTTGLSPFAMPLPTNRRVVVRCGVLGQSAITVPAAYSALIMGAGATRIQASFIRGALLSGGPPEVSVVAGHAIVGFTN